MDRVSRIGNLPHQLTRSEPTNRNANGELLPAESAAQTSHSLQQAFDQVIGSRALLFALLLTFGPLALPLALVSPKLGILSKVLLTVVTLGLTVVLPIALTLYFSHFAVLPALDAIRDANLRGGAI